MLEKIYTSDIILLHYWTEYEIRIILIYKNSHTVQNEGTQLDTIFMFVTCERGEIISDQSIADERRQVSA